MAPKRAVYNNYMKHTSLDNISKIYIWFESVIGVNRILSWSYIKLIYKIVSCIYTAFLVCGTVYVGILRFYYKPHQYMIIAKILQYGAVAFCGIIFRFRLQNYYAALDKFDNEIGYNPTPTGRAILILTSMFLLSLAEIAILCMLDRATFISCHVSSVAELFFIAHLLNLLSARLELINKVIKKSYTYDNKWVDKETKISMKSFMNLYCILIDAHKDLMDAMKWQILVIISTGFTFVLVVFFKFVSHIINTTSGERFPFVNVLLISLCCIEVLAMLPSCLSSDQLRGQVVYFRELLADVLYYDNLDKSERNAARGILALTETHNMTFSLLRFINVSISLPFSFLSLLATYLIIMLQFNKVLHSI